MNKLSTAALLCGVAALSSCAAGPHQTQRSLDDFDQKMYIENPWLNGVLWGVGVFPIAGFGAQLVDFFVVDAYHFWGKDAWDGTGTGFEHYEPAAPDGQLRSLMFSDAKFAGGFE
ncbi:MAG: hypothetical protein ACYS26_06750 [Planctomycetota bacterium]|jgi:hypothetical protein